MTLSREELLTRSMDDVLSEYDIAQFLPSLQNARTQLPLVSWEDGSFGPDYSLLNALEEKGVLQANRDDALTDRWYKLDYHPVQYEMWMCNKRFLIAHPGRRSGKTELAKRKGVSMALFEMKIPDYRVVFGAPTYAQAKKIYWKDLLALIPDWAKRHTHKSDLTIELWNGALIQVMGMDQPARIEGPPLDFTVLDEIANMPKEAWPEHVRGALSTKGRYGSAWLIGVPEGRNHFYDMVTAAEGGQLGDEWVVFHWYSSDIIPEEAENAKASLDDMTWLQEYGGQFISYGSSAYRNFNRDIHSAGDVRYDPRGGSVNFLFDFNVEPGVALIVQEQLPPAWLKGAPIGGTHVTAILDEIFIARNSNTERVCEELIKQWGWYKQDVFIYGDPSGGARRTSGLDGTDWDIVQGSLGKHWNGKGIGQVRMRVSRSAPTERARLNAVNSRFRSITGVISVAIAPQCYNLIKDFEGVELNEKGEIIKKPKSPLTHLSDAFGYYTERRHPVRQRVVEMEDL